MSGTSRRILSRLIARRMKSGENVEKIDRLIRERFEETWAVVFTDLVGFSRRTREFGIIHFLSVIQMKRQLLHPVLDEMGGLVIKEEADSWLILFRKPDQAVRAMLECQRVCEEYNAGVAEEDRVELCVGAGYGTVLKVGDEDVWGREVNYASKLGEDIARRGEILLTDAMREAIAGEFPESEIEHDSFTFGEMQLSYHRIRYTA